MHQSTFRILEVVQSLKKGGRTQRFFDTIIGLRMNKHNVIPLCLSQPDSWVNISQLELIDHEDLTCLQLIFQIRNLIKKHNIQVIHAHCELSQFYAGIAGFTCGVPTIGTFHRSDLSKYQPSKVNTLLKFFLSHYIAVSNDRLSLLTQNLAFSSNKCHAVHGGAIIEEMPTEASIIRSRKVLNIPEDQFILLSIGHLGKIKGHQDTITALSTLITQDKNVHLYIAGDGSENDKNDLLAIVDKLRMKKRVTFLGQINNAQTWLEACDIFIQPSIEEAFGLVFAEAGAKAKPVIATAVGGIKEIVVSEETGILVPPASPKALEKALNILINSKELRTLYGDNGYKRIAENFSLTNMVDKYIKIFTKTIK